MGGALGSGVGDFGISGGARGRQGGVSWGSKGAELDVWRFWLVVWVAAVIIWEVGQALPGWAMPDFPSGCQAHEGAGRGVRACSGADQGGPQALHRDTVLQSNLGSAKSFGERWLLQFV